MLICKVQHFITHHSSERVIPSRRFRNLDVDHPDMPILAKNKNVNKKIICNPYRDQIYLCGAKGNVRE